mgnify:CR=1 FL=1
MHIKNIFWLIVLISIVCHILCFSITKIVVIPIETRETAYASVSFLGPIAEGNSLGIILSKRDSALPDKIKKDDLAELSDILAISQDKPLGSSSKALEPIDYFESGNLSLKDIIGDYKSEPANF